VVEAVLQYGHSFICQRYKIPKQGTEIEIECRVYWQEKRRFLKLSVPTALCDAAFLGQAAFGVDNLPVDGAEAVAQKWIGLVSHTQGIAITCINEGSYGSDCVGGEFRLSLLRSPGYSAHPIYDRPVMPQDRFSPHIDQGERLFRFWINAGEARSRLSRVDHEALAHNEKPYALPYFPSGEGTPLQPAMTVDGETVQLSAFKRAEDGRGYVIRLYEAGGNDCEAVLTMPMLDIRETVLFRGFEVKTFRLDPASRKLLAVGLMERAE
jgi:alpha-mannosidase